MDGVLLNVAAKSRLKLLKLLPDNLAKFSIGGL
jgi:hypothetical protein